MNALTYSVSLKNFILVICVFYSSNYPLNAQIVFNGSFEGANELNGYGMDKLAPGWEKCNDPTVSNTPDLFPGVWDIWDPASDGYAYQNLVVDENGKRELLIGDLLTPLKPGNCYKLLIDAKVSNQMILYDPWGGPPRDYTNPVKLQIKFAYNDCYTSNWTFNIDSLHTGDPWETFSTIYTPADTMKRILIKANFLTNPPFYFGHSFVDNVRVFEAGDTIETISLLAQSGQTVTMSMPADEENYAYEWFGGDVECDTCSSNAILVEDSAIYYGMRKELSSCYHEIYEFRIQLIPEPDIFFIYPNPATTLINVKVPSDLINTKLQITDILGQLVDEQVIVQDVKLVSFDIEHYSPGIYFINLISAKKIKESLKWIKTTLK